MTIAAWILVLVALGLSGLYYYPVPKKPFNSLYARVPETSRQSLKAFRERHPLREIQAAGKKWRYASIGDANQTVLFLHGMGGGYDIWWQQIMALQGRYRVISVTYPPVHGLARLADGVLAILEKERIQRIHLVGSSLGGYLAQYLAAKLPHRIQKAVFANTFPPNRMIAEKSAGMRRLLSLLPEWAVMRSFRKTIVEKIYPASGYSELVKAYMLEQSHGMMRKNQFASRFLCVLDDFEAPDIDASGLPVLIIEADNDPLVEEALREMLKATYPSAAVKMMSDAGHFPYLNRAEEYTKLLEDFFEAK